MGACVSVQGDPDSAARWRLGMASKAKRFFVPSPAKEKAMKGENPVARFDLKSQDFAGSKEEIFFDSRAWLDSDCEDDFFSVNGEFTPSRGSTPNHQLSSPLTHQFDSRFVFEKFSDFKSEPSPTGKKKLSELLHETSDSEQIDVPDSAEESVDINAKLDEYKTKTDRPVNSSSATPFRSGVSSICSSEATPRRDLKGQKEKTWKTSHCCLPSLQRFGLDDRRQKMSPGPCTA
uniref:Uncharacterized protein n=1 Tax=Musa acuminata subsp. malaccensis TaxID=214687 RepID=A0A804L1I3_MUSAM|nr:PREDICTED: uncharacterized protein At3g27210 isoform X1 [Musa acuminata subsp. malaccensis]XP_009381332.1 PREDICTED: uncharacterized protein At3g27210 isoform X1 [Musa acuminata subsp. malaccensis]XP_018675090.1 PREDICTED: uncharacterized protein At3g27210 isoform X1 [Musa acuminata subsp. malaccensis]